MNKGTEIVKIRVRGRLGEAWAEWLGPCGRTDRPDGDTILRFAVRDEAEVYGLLRRLRDLGLTIRSFGYIETTTEEEL
jgi:hypothetical protein